MNANSNLNREKKKLKFIAVFHLFLVSLNFWMYVLEVSKRFDFKKFRAKFFIIIILKLNALNRRLKTLFR